MVSFSWPSTGMPRMPDTATPSESLILFEVDGDKIGIVVAQSGERQRDVLRYGSVLRFPLDTANLNTVVFVHRRRAARHLFIDQIGRRA